jgi:Tfp pilus assembly protein PilF
MKRYEASIKEMEAVLKIAPDNAEALNFVGYSYADRGINFDENEKIIVKGMKIRPCNGFMINNLGWICFNQSKLDSALVNLKKAMELLPNDTVIVE